MTTAFNTAGRMIGVNLAAFNGTQVNAPYYTVPQGTPASTWGYLPTGAMNRGAYGNGLLETIGYNNRLQINSMTDVKGTSTLFSKSYGYYDSSGHNNGNVLTITDALSSARNQTFTYDQLNRLASAAESDNGFNVGYSIDAWGNMQESGTSNFTPTFDGNNHMQGWSYDAAGNLLNDGAHSYTYDAECRIKTVDGTAATYTYGPDGERVRKDTSAGSTEYIYFGGSVIAELNPTSGAWTDYIFAGGSRIAKDTSTNASGAQYFQGDHLGSTRMMTDATGAVISSCSYAPYGEQVACSPDNASNHYRFTGKERDMAESGLDYFGARHYASTMGRFMTPDWSEGPATVPYAHLDNPQTLNLYSYVDNNPINGVDPTGHARNEYMVDPVGGGWGPFFMSTGLGQLGGPGITDDDSLTDLQLLDVLTAAQMSTEQGTPHSYSTETGDSRASQFTYSINDFIYRADQKLDQALGGGYQALANVLNILQPCHPPVSCGVVFPIEGLDADTTAAPSAADAIRLSKQLASEMQMSEAGAPIAGAGTRSVLRDGNRLVAQYGGNLSDWSKMTSSTFKAGDGTAVETHWYQNDVLGVRVEYKSIYTPVLPH